MEASRFRLTSRGTAGAVNPECYEIGFLVSNLLAWVYLTLRPFFPLYTLDLVPLVLAL
jgi:hypothetical protein